MNRLHRIFKSIIIMAIMAAAFIIALIFHSKDGVAWFNQNTSVTASGLNITAAASDIIGIQMNSYPVTGISGDTYTYAEDKAAAVLPTYDPLDIVFSEYKKALVLEFIIDVSRHMSLPLNVTTVNYEYYLGDNNYLSNCAMIYPAEKNEDGSLQVGTPQSFVSLTDGAFHEKVSFLNFENVEVKEGTNTYYMVMTYNEPAVKYIVKKNDLSNVTINYVNDIEFNFK